jgi:hypothetical protein
VKGLLSWYLSSNNAGDSVSEYSRHIVYKIDTACTSELLIKIAKSRSYYRNLKSALFYRKPCILIKMCLVSFSCTSLLRIHHSICKTHMWSHRFNSGFAHLLYEDEQEMCKRIKPNISFLFDK